MSDHPDQPKDTLQNSRRDFLKKASLSLGVGMGLGLSGCSSDEDQTGSRRLRAAFSNAGLESEWCALGKTTAELWGELLNVEVVWYDGEMDSEKQRNKIDTIVNEQWDFCCFQAYQTNSLAAPARKLKERGIPIISMDTLLVEMDEMRDTGVWLEVTPDHVDMAEKSTQYLVDKIGGKGKVIHIGGASAHSGAQGRERGFNNIIERYPDIKVVGDGVRWCNWDKEAARNMFETLLQGEKEPVAGAFFHSDQMALGCIPYLEKNSLHRDMVITAVDGQKAGLTAVREGKLAATTVNPVCRIHKTALMVGRFIVLNDEPVDSVPLEIITPGPLVSLDHQNALDAMFYLADEDHCMI